MIYIHPKNSLYLDHLNFIFTLKLYIFKHLMAMPQIRIEINWASAMN